MATITVNSGDNLQTAINDATAGDTLRIRAGTFTGYTAAVYPAASFKLTKQLTLQRYPGDARPVITYDPANVPWLSASDGYGPTFFVVPGVVGAVLDGLEVVGVNAVGDSGTFHGGECVWFGSAGSGCPNGTVRNCVIRDGYTGILYGNNSGLFENNEVRNIGVAHPDFRLHAIYLFGGDNTTIRYNFLHHTSGYGLHIYTPTNAKIYGNISTHNGGGGTVYGSGHLIYNNTISWNDGGGIMPLDQNRLGLRIDTGCSGVVVRNNLMWKNGVDNSMSGRDFCVLGTTGNTYDHNLYNSTDNSSAWPGTTVDATDIRTDPLFVSASPSDWKDFKLSPTSPARQAGLDLASPYNQGLSYS